MLGRPQAILELIVSSRVFYLNFSNLRDKLSTCKYDEIRTVIIFISRIELSCFHSKTLKEY